ncbi:serine hydrolase domain-containing protein [Actinoplanes sp. NPDC051861]|uniref:serine hydrolase domain-containing protein n=1 Tax=Actinoplanes sp. NPDC051861 TaxID=3155170 RepID=UPI00344A2D01
MWKVVRLWRSAAALMIGVMLAATAACTAQEEPAPAPACGGELGAALSAWARAGFSGAVAVSTGGRFECLAGYGTADDATGAPNTADTVYSIGSVSKAFTATAILKLAESGKLSLDDPVGKLVPAVTGPVGRATVRQVLLHTGGVGGSIGADDQPLDRAAAIAAINKLEPAFPPGTGNAYSNAGYTLLAIIIDTVSGMSYREYTLRHVLTLPGGAVTGGFWHGTPAAAGPAAAGYLDGRRARPIDRLPRAVLGDRGQRLARDDREGAGHLGLHAVPRHAGHAGIGQARRRTGTPGG